MSAGPDLWQQMGRKLLLATSNPGKTREFRAALQGLGLEIMDSNDFPGMPVVPERGETFRDNALVKARTVGAWSGLPCLADDSGLEVDALGGAPGVYSARFAGPGCSDADNNRKLLLMLEGLPRESRTARFVSVLVLVVPSGREIWARGVLEGLIGESPRGTEGFGYDPLFWLPQRGCTLAELSLEEKNRVSHRSQALRDLKKQLFRGEAKKAGEL